MFSDTQVTRCQAIVKHSFHCSSKTALKLVLKIVLTSYKFNFTCLASSKQTSGPFLYLGCLTISQGFGPSSVSLVKESDWVLCIIHYQNKHSGFTFAGKEICYVDSDSTETHINSYSSLFKLKKTNLTKPSTEIIIKYSFVSIALIKKINIPHDALEPELYRTVKK